MTRQEAIQILRTRIVPTMNWQEIHEAIDMAIEALQREEAEEKGYCHRIKPKQGRISKEDAIKILIKWSQKEFGYSDINRDERFIDEINALPSADTEWIPCSEKLPEKEELVLVTVWNDVVIAWRNRYGGWESVEDMYEKGDVIAWMPLPKPYREDGEEE